MKKTKIRTADKLVGVREPLLRYSRSWPESQWQILLGKKMMGAAKSCAEDVSKPPRL